MGNSNSRQTFNDKSHPHSKSIPNIGSVPYESEQIYFAHALRLQEKYLLEKNLRLQKQYNEQHQQNLCSSHQLHNGQCQTTNPVNRFSMHNNYGGLMHPQPHHRQHQQNLAFTSLVLDESNNTAKPKSKPSRKLNKLLQKFGTSSTDSADPSKSAKSLSRSLNRQRNVNTTKSLVMLGNNQTSNNKPINEINVETDFSSYGNTTRMSVGNRLSCVDTFKAIDDNMKAMHLSHNQIEVPRHQRAKLYGSIDLNRSIDLNDSNLIFDSASARYKYLPNAKTNTPRFSTKVNNSSSSGCSSIASSSNLSTSRRVNQRPDSSLSILSANKMSTPSPPPLTNHAPQHLLAKTAAATISSDNKKQPAHSTSSHLLTAASSTKSILSDTARINHCSTPLDTSSSNNSSHHGNHCANSNWQITARQANNSHRTGANLSHQHRSFCKKAKHRSSVCDHQLIKSDSVNSFSSILATKPRLNALQSSLSSTGNWINSHRCKNP